MADDPRVRPAGSPSGSLLARSTVVRSPVVRDDPAATWELTVVDDGRPARTVPLVGSMEVGRDADGIRLDDPRVSRRHIRLEMSADGLGCTDIGSTSGTRVNGNEIHAPTPLADGDEIAIGRSLLRVAFVAASPRSSSSTVLRAGQPRPAERAPGHLSDDAPAPRRRIPVLAVPVDPFSNSTELRRRVPIVSWHIFRVVTVAGYLGMCVALIVRPAGALFVFWRLLVPLIPLVLVISPGLWRNICPLAATNQLPRLLGVTRGRAAPAWLRDRGVGYLIAVTLFLGAVASRRVLLDDSATALAAVLLLTLAAAGTGGVVLKGKSGWCSSHCPMLPVERLYGQAPWVRVPNSHCQPCVGCTKNCYDFNPGAAYQADLVDPDPGWRGPRSVFAGSFPGVVVGYSVTASGSELSTWESVWRFLLAVAVSAGAFAAIDAVVRVPTVRIAATFGMIGFAAFFWFQAPRMTDAWSQVTGVDLGGLTWPIRISVIAIACLQVTRTVRIERLFAERVGPGDGPARAGAGPLVEAGGVDGPEVRFLPSDRRVVATAGQSILEVAESAGVAIEAGCRMGVCGADPVAVVDGRGHCSNIGVDEAKTLARLGHSATTTRLACVARITGPVQVALTPEPAGTHGTGVFAPVGDPSIERVVVIGNGVAGTTAADLIRRGHRSCEIHVVGREPHPLYNRMGIGRLVHGRSAMAGLQLVDASWYEDRLITAWLNTMVERIDLESRCVHLATGESLRWDRLVLAMGSSSATLSIPGADLPGCLVLRDADDAMAIRRHVQTHRARTAVVAGAGLLGLEAAHALRELGLAVTVLDRGSAVLAKQSDDRCSELLAEYFAGLGITILSSVEAVELEPGLDGHLARVHVSDGSMLDTSILVTCVGITPNVELARDAGITCHRGIVVDDRLATDRAGVYAVGDVAEVNGRVLGLWPIATAQAEVAAANVLGGDERFVDGDPPIILKGVGLDMTSAGLLHPDEADEVITLEGSDFEYRKLVIRDGRLVGGIVLGRPIDAPAVIAAVAARRTITDLDALRAGDWSALSADRPVVDRH